jgi:hypothetical protein
MTEHHVGDFLYHTELGTGQIVSISSGDHPDLTIAFERSPRHTISAYLAERSTSRLTPSGFHALAYSDYALALELLENNPAEATRLVLQDFPETGAKTIEIHAYLQRYVPDWEKWWKKAQKALKDSPQIDTSGSKQQEYRLSGVALSRAEELYEAFWRSTSEGATRRRPESYERIQHELALRVLAAMSDGARLPPEKEEVLRDWLLGEVTRPGLPLGVRFDALFRCVERRWLSKDESGKSIAGMISTDLQLSSLEPFVRSRLVDYCLACDRSDLTDRILLTGLRSVPEEVRRIEGWVLGQADPQLVVNAVFYLLSTSTESGGEAATGASQLTALQSLLRLLPAVGTELTMWRGIADATVALGAHILAQEGPRLRSEVPTLIGIASLVASRAGESGVVVQEELAGMLVGAGRRSEHALMVLGSLEEAPPEFAQEVRRAFYGSFVPPLGSALDGLAESLGLAELVTEAAALERDNQALWAGIASVIVKAASGASEERLLAWLPTIETVSSVDADAEWRRPLDALRERAYEGILGRLLAGLEDELGGAASRVLDGPAVTAMVRVVRRREAELGRELQDSRAAFEQAEVRVDQLEAELQSREAALGELGGRLSRGSQDAKQLERVRILRAVAETTAELERYAFVRQLESPELRGTLTRLASVLASFGIEQSEGPGETIPWDASYCQLPPGDSTQVEPGMPVRVEERGYFFNDPGGVRRILKTVLVVAPGRREG